jgi:FAD/FMN-containing dehydrogenase
VPAVEEMVAELPTPSSHVFWWPWQDPRPLERCALSITAKHYVAAFSGWTDAADEAKYVGWPASLMRRADRLSTGIQLADENLLGRPESRFMTDENLQRLERLRDRYDPDGLFATYLYGGET